MEYSNFKCQASCEDPHSSLGCNNTCAEEEACICRDGFLRKGDQCVSPEECSCFMEDVGVIPVNIKTFSEPPLTLGNSEGYLPQSD